MKIGPFTGPTLLRGFSEILYVLSIFRFRFFLKFGVRILKVMLLRICDFRENRVKKASLSLRLWVELHLYVYSETASVKLSWQSHESVEVSVSMAPLIPKRVPRWR